MVTAETAVVLPVLLLVLAAVVSAVVVVGAHLRCVDAAREAARGEVEAQVRALAARAAPEGAVTAVVVAGGEVRVTVSARVPPLGVGPAVAVGASAVARLEPGVAPG